MSNRKYFAQIGVFLLVALNGAAYYVFWPRGEAGSVAPTGAKDNLVQSLRVEKEASANKIPAPPSEFARPTLPADNAPVPPPSLTLAPPAPVARESRSGDEPDGEVLSKLIERIRKEKEAESAAPVPAPPLAAPVGFQPIQPLTPTGQPTPRTLPPLMADPVPNPLGSKKAATSLPIIPVSGPSNQALSTTALTKKLMQSPWLLRVEVIGAQTQLHAQLQQPMGIRTVAEFKILCDRVEMKAPEGAMQALGKVTFTGAGLTGSCERLTVRLNELRLVFEQNVQVACEAGTAPTSLLSGERLIWEFPSQPRDARPATFALPPPVPHRGFEPGK